MVHGRTSLCVIVSILISGLAGCASTGQIQQELDLINSSGIPRELDKATLPVYRVEPPDVLLIESVNNIRTQDAPLQVGDAVHVRLGNPEPIILDLNESPDAPLSEAERLQAQYKFEEEVRSKFLDGDFVIHPDGKVNLGPLYGNVQLEGLTLTDAQTQIEKHLTGYARDTEGNPIGLKNPQVSVTLPDLAGKQQVAGEHLVRPDGTISLGIYGDVYVTGMSLEEVRFTLQRHLSQFIHQPEVRVDVLAYNSKSIYVITDGGGFGERVQKLPVTGNETVLDAIAAIEGLSEVSSKRIWVARPAPAGTNAAQIMDVHWRAITQEGITSTNYQLFPGDRVYISADKMIQTDNFIAKATAPLERIAGFILLGSSVQKTLRFIHINNQGGF
ncbi:MAG TPA: polysaccharide biosynthesis/export family protein [Planctomycetaceae bacterium]|nr:polysaccharide biosynthesis/export family protein [Planctomycetaceae bacterium]